MEGSGDSGASCDQGSQLVTPYPKISEKFDLEPVNMENLSLGSDGDSSVASLKESPRSLLSSLWDSDFEYVIASDNEESSKCIDVKEDFPDMEQQNQSGEVGKEDNNMVWEEANKSYDELLKKFIENEEEIVKLKIQIEESKGQLDFVSKELNLKKDDLEHEKGQVQKLQKQTAELETHVPDCCYKIAKLVEQLEVANENLKISNDENARLRKELGSRSSETHQLQGQLEVAQKNVAKLECEFDYGRKHIQGLENRIVWYAANETNLDLEVQKLKDEILHAQALFSLENDQLQSDIASLSEMKMQLSSRLDEWESRSNALENIIKQYEAENLKQEELHATQQMVLLGEITSLKEELGQERHVVEVVNKKLELHVTQQMVLQREITSLKEELGQERYVIEAVNKELELQVTQQIVLQGEISSLNEELGQRRHDVEAVNKEFDRHKQRFDMLVIERDEANAKIDRLTDLISFQDYEKATMERNVEELQKEVIRQNVVISDRAKEKREAIRQLCFSLEHYRSGYQELLRAFASHRRHSSICWP